jgi:hypothetical protein
VHPQRIPIATILNQKSKVIGFSWGQMLDKGHLCAERDMPFDVSQDKKQEGLAIAQYWAGSVIGTKSSLFLFRELALLKRYRSDLSSYLSFPMYAQSLNTDCELVLCWTCFNSNTYKWCLGLGMVPIHFFSAATTYCLAAVWPGLWMFMLRLFAFKSPAKANVN